MPHWLRHPPSWDLKAAGQLLLLPPAASSTFSASSLASSRRTKPDRSGPENPRSADPLPPQKMERAEKNLPGIPTVDGCEIRFSHHLRNHRKPYRWLVFTRESNHSRASWVVQDFVHESLCRIKLQSRKHVKLPYRLKNGALHLEAPGELSLA